MNCLWQIGAHGYPTKDLLVRVNLLENCFKKKKNQIYLSGKIKGPLITMYSYFFTHKMDISFFLLLFSTLKHESFRY